MNHLISACKTKDEELIGQVADEFTQRLNGGDNPDVEEYARQFPEIAAVLREVLTAVKLMRGPATGSSLPINETSLPTTLGEYQLLRVAGRGGMGVVYEAEHIVEKQRIAIKVLPFAATLDVLQLMRFKNEAQAAALLQHANIVPVYGMGSDQGVHYYAMEFIDGQTLAQVIATLRRAEAARTGSATEPAKAGGPLSPNPDYFSALETELHDCGAAFFRSAARIAMQAAEALGHAHSQGVI
ncbi:MAG: protein kinase domain-containing protein, partial [Candidatus Acidiferrum sp.]